MSQEAQKSFKGNLFIDISESEVEDEEEKKEEVDAPAYQRLGVVRDKKK